MTSGLQNRLKNYITKQGDFLLISLPIIHEACKYYELIHPSPCTGLYSLGCVTATVLSHTPSYAVVSFADRAYSAGVSLKKPLGLRRKLDMLKPLHNK